MSSLPILGIVAPGSMGSAVAKRLTTAGLTVLTNLDGRLPASRSRAHDAGMRDVPLSELASQSNWILSILPPSEAYSFAQKFKDAYLQHHQTTNSGHPLAFADCNAVNPATVKRISALFTDTPIKFIDAGIIGGPPKGDYDPVFYASADPADVKTLEEFEGLKKYGLNVKVLKGEGAGVGDASALKMSYAGITKGIIGVFTTMILAANASSPATSQALLHELADSQPQLLQRITTSVPGMLPKAYRWVGEMEEISAFVSGDNGEPVGQGDDALNGASRSPRRTGGEEKIHEGLARLYERIERSMQGLDGGEDVRVLKEFAEDAKKVLEQK
ncbi:6-phosphogluconate dehydrogenase C-terminal domain-like protein [Panus rudis PR-1116 ss-1]|nr:6-phosphogluconate dehydrogenase C-terminal domain-like protein [Panus rudis PR-1116 ss-1]